jgi:hypothetical protein
MVAPKRTRPVEVFPFPMPGIIGFSSVAFVSVEKQLRNAAATGRDGRARDEAIKICCRGGTPTRPRCKKQRTAARIIMDVMKYIALTSSFLPSLGF